MDKEWLLKVLNGTHSQARVGVRKQAILTSNDARGGSIPLNGVSANISITSKHLLEVRDGLTNLPLSTYDIDNNLKPAVWDGFTFRGKKYYEGLNTFTGNPLLLEISKDNIIWLVVKAGEVVPGLFDNVGNYYLIQLNDVCSSVLNKKYTDLTIINAIDLHKDAALANDQNVNLGFTPGPDILPLKLALGEGTEDITIAFRNNDMYRIIRLNITPDEIEWIFNGDIILNQSAISYRTPPDGGNGKDLFSLNSIEIEKDLGNNQQETIRSRIFVYEKDYVPINPAAKLFQIGELQMWDPYVRTQALTPRVILVNGQQRNVVELNLGQCLQSSEAQAELNRLQAEINNTADPLIPDFTKTEVTLKIISATDRSTSAEITFEIDWNILTEPDKYSVFLNYFIYDIDIGYIYSTYYTTVPIPNLLPYSDDIIDLPSKGLENPKGTFGDISGVYLNNSTTPVLFFRNLQPDDVILRNVTRYEGDNKDSSITVHGELPVDKNPPTMQALIEIKIPANRDPVTVYNETYRIVELVESNSAFSFRTAKDFRITHAGKLKIYYVNTDTFLATYNIKLFATPTIGFRVLSLNPNIDGDPKFTSRQQKSTVATIYYDDLFMLVWGELYLNNQFIFTALTFDREELKPNLITQRLYLDQSYFSEPSFIDLYSATTDTIVVFGFTTSGANLDYYSAYMGGPSTNTHYLTPSKIALVKDNNVINVSNVDAADVYEDRFLISAPMLLNTIDKSTHIKILNDKFLTISPYIPFSKNCYFNSNKRLNVIFRFKADGSVHDYVKRIWVGANYTDSTLQRIRVTNTSGATKTINIFQSIPINGKISIKLTDISLFGQLSKIELGYDLNGQFTTLFEADVTGLNSPYYLNIDIKEKK